MDVGELFEETERLKIRFIQAYERLVELGKIDEQELEDVIYALDHIDELTKEELADKLGGFKKLFSKEEE